MSFTLALHDARRSTPKLRNPCHPERTLLYKTVAVHHAVTALAALAAPAHQVTADADAQAG